MAFVEDYLNLVQMALMHQATGFLSALAEYGRRWEVLVETVAPMDDPFTITMSEDRPLDHINTPTLRTRSLRQRVVLQDARSVHLEIRAADPDIHVANAFFRTVNDEFADSFIFEGKRLTEEIQSLYTSDEGRPYALHLVARLSPARSRRIALWIVVLATWGSALLAGAVEEPELLAKLGLLTLPTTFVGALVLTRDASPLARRLQLPQRLAVGGGVLVLYPVVVLQLLGVAIPGSLCC